MSLLELNNIVKKFGNFKAVDDVSFTLDEGEFLVLLGPSGCGKTTILRLIAGFIYLDNGSILLGGEEISSKDNTLPPNKRNMSMVFQSYAVWPHMTVFENVAYGLKLRKYSKKFIREGVHEALKMVRMDKYTTRYSHELSGGQQQRVALARALAISPKLLLLDEPLSNLDAKLRLEMRIEIKDLHRRLGYTSIYVTHDQSEAMVLADRIILLEDGMIKQQGPPIDVYKFPNCAFSANFFGETNLFSGIVKSIHSDSEEVVIQLSLGADVRVKNLSCSLSEFKEGDSVTVSVRASSMEVSKNPSKLPSNILKAKIEKAIFLGDIFNYELSIGGIQLRAHTGIQEEFQAKEEVYIGFEKHAPGVCCFKS